LFKSEDVTDIYSALVSLFGVLYAVLVFYRIWGREILSDSEECHWSV